MMILLHIIVVVGCQRRVKVLRDRADLICIAQKCTGLTSLTLWSLFDDGEDGDEPISVWI